MPETMENASAAAEIIMLDAEPVEAQPNRRKILEEWNKYNKRHNQIFSRRLEKYKKARMELCRRFVELAELQRQALIVQHHNIDQLKAMKNEQCLRKYLPLKYEVEPLKRMKKPVFCDSVSFNGRQIYPDAAFFIYSGELSLDLREKIDAVLLFDMPLSEELNLAIKGNETMRTEEKENENE